VARRALFFAILRDVSPVIAAVAVGFFLDLLIVARSLDIVAAFTMAAAFSALFGLVAVLLVASVAYFAPSTLIGRLQSVPSVPIGNGGDPSALGEEKVRVTSSHAALSVGSAHEDGPQRAHHLDIELSEAGVDRSGRHPARLKEKITYLPDRSS